MIYEYVLSFGAPLQHATKMQPFVKKLSGVDSQPDSPGTGSEIETAADPRPVNTSILTASKLIYAEAIAVFYARNTIHFNAQMCTLESLVSPRATDLSLAKHIVVKMDDAIDPEVYGRFSKAMKLSLITIPAIFPKVRTCSVYVSADTEPDPSTTLIATYCSLRRQDMFNDVHFDGVGSFNAFLTCVPWLKLTMQSRQAIDCWAKPTGTPAATGHWNEEVTARSLYQGSRADSQNIYGRTAQRLFDVDKRMVKLPELEDVDHDGYEYWTGVDACLSFLEKSVP